MKYRESSWSGVRHSLLLKDQSPHTVFPVRSTSDHLFNSKGSVAAVDADTADLSKIFRKRNLLAESQVILSR